MYRTTGLLLLAILVAGGVAAADQDAELKQFQGKWEVVELVENGMIIPREAIREWLPSGGQFEIAENAILFTAPDDGEKHVKVFSVDATQYPKGIEISTRDKPDGLGIYRFDGGRLILCFSDPGESERPKEFAAQEGSKRLLMTLERPTQESPKKPEPVKAEASGTAAQVLTDAQVKAMLTGTWKYTDSVGALFVNFQPDGTFSTMREVQQIRLFQKVFVQTPMSSGKWSVANGRLTFNIERSVHRDRAHTEFDFAVRSISERDFIFVDYLGRVGQAVRVR